MTAATLDFRKNHSLIKQLFAVLAIVATGVVTAGGLAWITSSAYGSYSAYVNRPPFSTYTSKLGSISFVYPSSVVLEKRSYNDYIESVTLHRSYNANDVTDTGLQTYDGLIFVHVWNMACKYEGCTSITEKMKREAEIFRQVYFYEDPEDPNALQEKRNNGYTVNLVHDTRAIDGHASEYYSVEEIGTDYESGDYKKHVYILIPVGDFLYEIDGTVDTYSYDETVHDTSYLDKLVESVKIGGGAS